VDAGVDAGVGAAAGGVVDLFAGVVAGWLFVMTLANQLLRLGA
jgi:hypothetical protein